LLLGRGGKIIHPSAIIRAESIKRIGGYLEEDWSYAEDHDLWLRLSEHGLLANVPDILLKYRISLTRISNVKRFEQLREAERICNLHRAKRGLPSISIDKKYDRWTKREHFVEAALRSGFIKTAMYNWLLVQAAHVKRVIRSMRRSSAKIPHPDGDSSCNDTSRTQRTKARRDGCAIEDTTR
jgi:hypothetical protein